jgi:hypothetical protein
MDALIARFEQCRFDQVRLNVQFWSPGATLVFAGCTMSNLLDNGQVTEQAATHAGVFFDGCSFSYFGGAANQAPGKSLNDLFPGWRQRIQ